jgi:hypothetical protein
MPGLKAIEGGETNRRQPVRASKTKVPLSRTVFHNIKRRVFLTLVLLLRLCWCRCWRCRRWCCWKGVLVLMLAEARKRTKIPQLLVTVKHP